ncbi:MAG TPA: type VI secretion system-associated protein TagF [Caulobacteraceae bacterium]
MFGKLPRLGDFVARGLTARSRRAWDTWLSDDLQRSRAALGDRFEAAHEASPVWRFVRAPSEFGPAGQAGALAPSIDAAGRRFFIVIGGEGPAAEFGEIIAEQMEELIYRAFQEGLDADAVVETAQGVLDGMPDKSTPPTCEAWWTGQTRIDCPPARLIDAELQAVRA